MAANVGLLLIAVVLIAGVLWDTFETIILPRRVTRRFRLPRLFYRATWVPWSALARHVPAGNRRESFLSFFGPLSLLLLFGAWALSLILGFAIFHLAMGSPINVRNETVNFWTDLYLSGSTFFTLGGGMGSRLYFCCFTEGAGRRRAWHNNLINLKSVCRRLAYIPRESWHSHQILSGTVHLINSLLRDVLTPSVQPARLLTVVDLPR